MVCYGMASWLWCGVSVRVAGYGEVWYGVASWLKCGCSSVVKNVCVSVSMVCLYVWWCVCVCVLLPCLSDLHSP